MSKHESDIAMKSLFILACVLLSLKTLADDKNCRVAVGSFSNQSISVSGQNRFYFLHVPKLLDCRQKFSIILDFHGVAPMGEIPPEELFSNEAMISVSESTKSLLIRFRGVPRGAQQDAYAWDDKVDESKSFVRAVIDNLSAIYNIDFGKIYLLGFSNGTNFAGQFLNGSPFPIAGVALFSGGLFSNFLPDLNKSSARIYFVSGIADSMGRYAENTIDLLKKSGLPEKQIYFRETQGNHRISANDLNEGIQFLFYGIQPEDVENIEGAELIGKFNGAISAIALNKTNEIFVTTSRGEMFKSPDFKRVLHMFPDPYFRIGFTDLCFNSSGKGIAVTNSRVAVTADNGETWVPLYLEKFFNKPYVYTTNVRCSDQYFVIGGESVFVSNNLSNWLQLVEQSGFAPFTFAFGGSDQLLSFGAYDSWAIGELKQLKLDSLVPQWKNLWINDIVYLNQTWLAVADAGRAVIVSGVHISETHLTNSETDIYRIALSKNGTLALAGSKGYLALSSDMAKSLKMIHVNGKGAITAILWIDNSSLLVGTCNGLLFKYKLPKINKEIPL